MLQLDLYPINVQIQEEDAQGKLATQGNNGTPAVKDKTFFPMSVINKVKMEIGQEFGKGGQNYNLTWKHRCREQVPRRNEQYARVIVQLVSSTSIDLDAV